MMDKRMLLWMVLLSQLCVSAFSQEVGFANHKVRLLAEALPLQRLPQADTLQIVPQLSEEKALVFKYGTAHELVHIGVSLFTDETKRMLDTKVCDFLERFWLELLLQREKAGVLRKLEEFHVRLERDGVAFGAAASFSSVARALQEMKMPLDFTLFHNGKRAEAVWTFSGHSLRLDFPLYRDLIEGTDKKESDADLYQRLQGAAFVSSELADTPADVSRLTAQGDDVYLSDGDSFIIDALSSRRYYAKFPDGTFEPLFSEKYPIYSLNNLFLTYRHGKEKMLQITHRQYGHFTPTISIPLVNMLAFFEHEFDCFCHTAYNKRGELECLVVFNHKTLNYVHMLRVRTTEAALFGTNPTFKADFYSNIPQHYIKSLLK